MAYEMAQMPVTLSELECHVWQNASRGCRVFCCLWERTLL